MRLPGFTADKALQDNSKTYTSIAVSERQPGVVPQFFRCMRDYCCNEWGYCIHRGHVLM